MELRNIDFVSRTLFDVLPRHLEPFVRDQLERTGMSERWESLFRDSARRNGISAPRYDLSDPQTQLKLLYVPFEGSPVVRVSKPAQDRAREVAKVRNRFAHPQPGGVDDDLVLDALVQTRRFFEEIDVEAAVAEISELRTHFLQYVADRGRPRDAASQTVPDSVPERPEAPAPVPIERDTAITVEPQAVEPRTAGPGTTVPQEAQQEERRTAGTALSSLTVQVDTDFDVISYALAYNQPTITVGIAVSGANEAVPTLRVSPALVAGEQALTMTGDRIITLDPGQTVTTSVRLVLDRTQMLDIEIAAKAQLRVDLSAGGDTRTVWVPEDVSEPGTVDVLGPNSWRLAAADDTQDLRFLTAFVRPQQPAVSALISEATEILRAATGSDALDAYQAQAERTDQIVDAVCRALHARGITYANPPAGWIGVAQRIRPAQEVLEDRRGTCLDLAVLLAAALEDVGIDVQLWLAKGHIFVGYWRTESTGRSSAVSDLAHSANDVGARNVQLIETTMLASRPDYPGLRALHDADEGRYLGRAQDEVIAVIEVKTARRTGVLPLPVRSRDADGAVVESEYRPRERDLAALVREEISDGARRVTRDTDVPPRIQQWKRELLDLSLRNRLINLTPRAALPLAVPEELLGTFEDMIHDRVVFQLDPDNGLAAVQGRRGVGYGVETDPPTLGEALADGRRVTIALGEETYTSSLMKLANAARTIVQETGANNLYLALGTLVWETDGKPLRSPLILIPVTIRPRSKARGSHYELVLDDTGASTPNHSLLERLRVDLGIEIPGLADPVTDDAGVDIAAAFAATREAITRHELPFRVEDTVHLGLFNFAGFRLWKDLEDDWRSLLRTPLVRHLTLTPGEDFDDPAAAEEVRDLDETVAALPTASDASQAAVVAEAVAGRTMMVQGPPGTGKSQTITNLIVQAMVEGKRVLFVAEKQAALEVVRRRLDAAGVGDVVLNLHDHGQSTKSVKDALRRALELRSEGDESGLRVQGQVLESVRGELVDYRRSLHERNAAGMSYYSARAEELTFADSVPVLPVPVEFLRTVDRDRLDELQLGLHDVGAAARGIDLRPDHPWRALGRSIPRHQVDRAADRSRDLVSRVAPVQGPLAEVLRGAQRPEHLALLGELLAQPWTTWQMVQQISDPRWEPAVGGVLSALNDFWALPKPALELYRPEVLGGPLDDVRTELTTARGALFLKRGKARRAVSALAAWEITPVDLDLSQSEQLINELIHLRDTARELAGRLVALPGFQHWQHVDLFRPDVRDGILSTVDWLRNHRLPADPQPWEPSAYRRGAEACFAGRQQYMAPHLTDAATAWAALEETIGGPLPAAGPDGPLGTFSDRLSAGTAEELSAHGLRLWNDLALALDPLRRAGLNDTAEAILDGTVPHRDISLSFTKGMAVASREERERTGGLRSFDGESHDDQVARFARVSTTLRDTVQRSALSRILAHRSVEEPGVGRTEIGRLRRDIGGRTMPKIRRLFSQYGPAITRMTPCVLVSPDSAARFIPSELQLFDIVVFDEASQITPATAIGAMGRGRSVVVVGDSKQMPPTRFAELTRDVDDAADDPDEATVPVDEESVLEECRRAGIVSHDLTWHYRSSNEALIAFSNELYYEGRLASFPSPTVREADPGPNGHGVSMRRVDGHFYRAGEGASRKQLRTNPIEAAAIVDEILARFARAKEAGSGMPSLGVITFNVQQRDLIETMLRETGDDDVVAALEDAEGVFVKNLENVQGDERDVILFSIAFSPNASGEVPLNFGPLNREGGERRLNVAVTRARRQVIVFSSFEPEQLRAERSTSVGLRHLRAYLDMARHGTGALRSNGGTTIRTDRHREEIARALEERGLVVEQAIGLSGFRVDLGLALPDDPGQLLVAVLLDGDDWALRATEYDRDVLPAAVLSGSAGWGSVQRVWMPDWIHRQTEVVERLVAAVEAAAQEPEAPEEPVVEATAPAPTATVHSVPETAERHPLERVPEDLDATEPDDEAALVPMRGRTPTARDQEASAPSEAQQHRWSVWRVDVVRSRDVLDMMHNSRAAKREIDELAQRIVAYEQPIRVERLCKLIANTYGLERVRQTRVDEIWKGLDRSAFAMDADRFAWPVGTDLDAPERYRPGILAELPADDVHPAEFRAAVREEYRRNAFADPEAVLRAAMSTLGGGKLTAKLRAPLHEAYVKVTRE